MTRSTDDERSSFLFDMATRQLTKDRAPIHVEPKVFDLIALLATHPHELVETRTLSAELWPNQTVCQGALRQCVWSARRALQDSARTSEFIRTVQTRGYLFVGRVVAESRTSLRLSPMIPGVHQRQAPLEPGFAAYGQLPGSVRTSATDVTTG